jgi:diphosphomevalonate decarboxylase
MFTTNDFIPTAYSHNIESGEFLWTAPSNIALVKYWEKDNQIPANPSVSFTLNNCKTITKLTLLKKKVQILFL